MKAADATAMINPGITAREPQQWADLGCGSGTFTYALAGLLPQGSSVYAIDRQRQHFDLPVKFIQANFETNELPFTGLDGILMANSLHYVYDKKQLINKLEKYFTAGPNFLIVEYDTSSANQWVPYPVSFLALTELFTALGYTNISKLAERPSVYNSAKMYAALIKR